MPRPPAPMPKAARRMRGFEPAAGLLRDPVRMAGEKRGFAVARLLTHWAEIVGADLASCTRPVKVGYAQGGLGASLTLLTSGAVAPMVEMQKDSIRAKVNACYGYAAIARILLTQTAASGFSEGQAEFRAAQKPLKTPVDPAVLARAAGTADGVRDTGLRDALALLAQNVLTRKTT
jgi:hypothetical protein